MSQRPYAGNMAPQVMLRDFLVHVVSVLDRRLAGKEPASAPAEMHVEARGVVWNAIDEAAVLNAMYCDAMIMAATDTNTSIITIACDRSMPCQCDAHNMLPFIHRLLEC